MMRWLTQYASMLKMQALDQRTSIVILTLINVAFIAGFVYGYRYIMGDIPPELAIVLTTGAATNALIFVALVMLPQMLAEQKHDGRLDYIRSLPISREAYLLAMVTLVAGIGLPSSALAFVAGAWVYDLSYSFDPMLLVVAPLIVVSLAGFGAAIGLLSRGVQVTNAITQMTIFYVVFFAPVMVPKENLPNVFQAIGAVLPPTYAADALRATTTDLPNTNLMGSLAALAVFAVLSLAAASTAMRRRG